MAPSARFWDRIAERYAKRPVADEASYQRKLKVTREYLRPDMEVLEFGCGTGSTAIAHAPYVRQIRAIDISSKMIGIAQDKMDAAKVANVAFARSTIEEFEAPEASFDAVLGLSILHLLEDREQAIAKVYRLLKSGGVFVSNTACIGDMMWVLRLVLPIGTALGLVPLVRVLTVEDLAKSITAAGFEIDHQWQPGPGKAVFVVARKA